MTAVVTEGIGIEIVEEVTAGAGGAAVAALDSQPHPFPSRGLGGASKEQM